ncbi:LptA/OstA family protein [uncultured Megasphaera sp.]|uniref:LptA/OstA family protein n=1 Tax=uncultured Megasphaera sp. TaxID=165188 RepID=UPI00259531D5|nr:LptA/OstA family protein [uncultured Megasphaera sp.]
MKHIGKAWGMIIGIVALISTSVLSIQAAPVPVSVTADQMEFNGQAQTITAAGHVVVSRGTTKITGQQARYHIQRDVAELTGHPVLTQPGLLIQAKKVGVYQQQHVVADGGVYIKQKDKEIKGNKVDYLISREYGIITGNAFLQAQGYQLHADKIEAWLGAVKAIGTGRVRIYSATERLHASGNQAVYTQTPGKDDGVLVLTGNVSATQRKSMFRGEAVQVRRRDESIRTFSRSTIVISPSQS